MKRYSLSLLVTTGLLSYLLFHLMATGTPVPSPVPPPATHERRPQHGLDLRSGPHPRDHDHRRRQERRRSVCRSRRKAQRRNGQRSGRTLRQGTYFHASEGEHGQGISRQSQAFHPARTGPHWPVWPFPKSPAPMWRSSTMICGTSPIRQTAASQHRAVARRGGGFQDVRAGRDLGAAARWVEPP